MFDTHRLDEALRSRRLKLEQEREALLERGAGGLAADPPQAWN